MEELKRHWPFGKFPLLVDDGEVIAETTCIIEHLQAKHPGPNVWIPDGEEGRRVRFLDRFFDLHVRATCSRRSTTRSGPQACGDAFGAEQGAGGAAHRLRLARSEPARRPNGRPATHSRSPTARPRPPYSMPTGSSEIGDERPRLKAYRARLLAHPAVQESVEEARPYRPYFPLGAPDRD